MRTRRFDLTPLLVLFGATVAWAGGTIGSVHTPFLFNRTSGTADVRITWVLRSVPCATSPEELAGTLGPSDLDDPIAVTLRSGETATLGGPPASGTSPVGVCPSTSQTSNTSECHAAILESAGVTPVLMVAPQSWVVFGEGYICTPGPSPKSRCAPKLDPTTDGGDDALSLMSHNGGAFVVTHSGSVERSIRIAPVDPAAIATRPTTSDGCRETRDAYHALAQSTACTSDADCQALEGVPIPGEVGTCTLFVNQSVSAADVDALKSQWTSGQCATTGSSCPAPLGVVCRAGACGELCAGVALPACDPSCDAYASDPNGVCSTVIFGCSGSSEQCHAICTDANLQKCVCHNDTVVCTPRALVDSTCPLPCRR